VGASDGARIETERLILRPLALADLGPMHDVYGEREVMRYIGSGGSHSETVDDSERRLQRLIDHQEAHGFSLWAVTDRDSGTVMGDAGLILLGHRGPEIELGYRLAKPYWGKGYATEAAAAWLAHGFGELGLERIVAVTHPENLASQRVLEKVGMQPAGTTSYDGVDALLFALDRDAHATA
jgi:[ribosomal protein S5]-alanine N-acetyltransferase